MEDKHNQQSSNQINKITLDGQKIKHQNEQEDKNNNQKIKKMVEDYYEYHKKEEENIGQGIENESLKFVFHLLITFSYGLFVIAILLNLNNTQQTDKFKQFASSSEKLPFLIVLTFQAILIYCLMKIYKEDNKLPAERRKLLNFYTDIARVITYIVLLAFVQPFVFKQQSNITLFISFWLFIVALVLFLIRKIIKWSYFRFGKGKDIVILWQNKRESGKKEKQLLDIMNTLNLIIKKQSITMQMNLKKNINSFNNLRPLQKNQKYSQLKEDPWLNLLEIKQKSQNIQSYVNSLQVESKQMVK